MCIRDRLKLTMPPFLQLFFIAYPLVTTVAFDSFPLYVFEDNSFLKADVQVEYGSAAYDNVVSWAVVAIVAYPVGILVIFGALLFAARDAIMNKQPTALSESIAFLHREFEPHMFWWELMEMLRRLVLVGLMVLYPRKILKLVLGTLVSAAFLLFQVQASPYAVSYTHLTLPTKA